MKTKREMGFLSLVLSILVAIQLIPFGLTQVKAEGEPPAAPAAPAPQEGGKTGANKQDDKSKETVEVTFSIEGDPVTIELSKDDIKRAIQNKSRGEVQEAIKSLIKKSDQYKKIELEHPDKNIKLDVVFSTETKDTITTIQSQSINYKIKANANVTQKKDLTIEVAFPSENDNEKVTITVGAADAAKLKDATQDAILKLIKDSDAYKDKLPKLEKYKDKEDKDIELTLVEGALGDVQKYLANGQKDKTTIQAKATVKSVELNPLKITVKFAGTVKGQEISHQIEVAIPGKIVTDLKATDRKEAKILGWITGEPGKAAYEAKLQELQATYNVGDLTVDPAELEKFKKFDGQADNQEIIVKAALTAKATQPSESNKPTESSKNTGTKNTEKKTSPTASASSDDDNASVTIGRRDGENLDKDSKFTIVVVVDPLTQSIVRENSIPMPEGDRFIGQIFRIIIKEDGKPLTRKDMSKLYDINLSLATFEKARKNNLTVYGRSDEDEKWERINRFGYNKDGTLTINGIDTYTEFVVWLDQEKNDRKLQFAGSMNAKDPGNRQGFTPRVLAPYNPQVAGAVSSNPNAYLPTTGEGNFTGWVVATLVLAAAAFAMKKIIK